ncbi:MAG: ComF family protein [Humidesulfovibrio sp.]|nr:ComF family protein [Humidesulfovibrio sp.]
MISRGLTRLALLAGLRRWLLLDEARCPGCGLVVQAGPGWQSCLCPDCRLALALAPQEAAACPGCGQLSSEQSDGGQSAVWQSAGGQAGVSPAPPALCAACQDSPRPWGRLVFFGAYEGRLRDLILAYKFKGRLGLGRQLQECLAVAFERQAAMFPELGACELVVPVPLHVRRLAWRGYNQSSELARLLARRRGLPLRQEALSRVRRTVPQMELGRSERAENIRGAFAANPEILAGRTALLVDDIMTTGSTLEECSRMMRAAGAAQVHVLVLARA